MPSISPLRSIFVTGVVASLVVLAIPAQAGSSGARLSDQAGDIVVPSLDVVSGLIRLDATSKTRTLTMTATMNADITGPPADYDLVTGTRQGATCHSLATRVRWNGASLVQSYQHSSTYACQSDATPAVLAGFAEELAQYAVGGEPVEAKAGGNSVSVTLPAPSWLRPGSLAGFAVLTHTTAFGVATYVGPAQVGNFDLAGLEHDWRVG